MTRGLTLLPRCYLTPGAGRGHLEVMQVTVASARKNLEHQLTEYGLPVTDANLADLCRKNIAHLEGSTYSRAVESRSAYVAILAMLGR